MGKPAPSAPTPVDPTQVAAAQTASNEQTANYQSTLNNTNVVGPDGSVTYNQNPTTNQWTQTTSLSPAEQSIFNQGTQAQSTALGLANTQLGAVGQALGQTVTPGQLSYGVNNGPIQTGYSPGGQIQTGYNAGGPIQGQIGNQNINQAVDQTIGANYAQQMQLLQPQMQQASEQQQAQLIAQGLNPNDAAYQNSQTLFNNGQAVQMAQVAGNAVNAGNAEQNTLFGQQAQQGQFANAAQLQGNQENAASAAFTNAAQAQQNSQDQAQAMFANTAQGQQNSEALANANLNNAAQQQNFQNQAYAQQLPINEFDALMSSGQVQAPTSTPAQTTVAPTDVLGAYGLQAQQQQNAYQAQMANYNSSLGGLFNLGSAALAFA